MKSKSKDKGKIPKMKMWQIEHIISPCYEAKLDKYKGQDKKGVECKCSFVGVGYHCFGVGDFAFNIHIFALIYGVG